MKFWMKKIYRKNIVDIPLAIVEKHEPMEKIPQGSIESINS
jgi:hypothetical protein